MTKKNLNTQAVVNELRGQSAFFKKPPQDTPLSDKPPTEKKQSKGSDRTGIRRATKKPSNRDTTTPRNHDTTASRYHDTVVELVRKAVRELGKEAATHRFTLGEKKAIADVIYTYKSRGIKTSENEIARIAINFVIQDHEENGKNSILHKVLKALNE